MAKVFASPSIAEIDKMNKYFSYGTSYFYSQKLQDAIDTYKKINQVTDGNYWTSISILDAVWGAFKDRSDKTKKEEIEQAGDRLAEVIFAKIKEEMAEKTAAATSATPPAAPTTPSGSSAATSSSFSLTAARKTAEPATKATPAPAPPATAGTKATVATAGRKKKEVTFAQANQTVPAASAEIEQNLANIYYRNKAGQKDESMYFSKNLENTLLEYYAKFKKEGFNNDSINVSQDIWDNFITGDPKLRKEMGDLISDSIQEKIKEKEASLLNKAAAASKSNMANLPPVVKSVGQKDDKHTTAAAAATDAASPPLAAASSFSLSSHKTAASGTAPSSAAASRPPAKSAAAASGTAASGTAATTPSAIAAKMSAVASKASALAQDAGEDANKLGEKQQKSSAPKTMQHQYNAAAQGVKSGTGIGPGSGSRLVDMVEQQPIGCTGDMGDRTQEQYIKDSQEIAEKIKENYQDENVTCTCDEKGTIIATIPFNDGSEDQVTRSLDPATNTPKVTLTNPPDDLSITIMLEMNGDITPLKVTHPCEDEDVALRLFEASVISGRSLELHDDDFKMLSDSGNPRFKYLLSLQEEGNEEALKTFRDNVQEHEKTKGPWKFGQSVNTELQSLIDSAPTPTPSPDKLHFSGPKG